MEEGTLGFTSDFFRPLKFLDKKFEFSNWKFELFS